MPFTPRNWTDGSAPAVSAANIEDLETRTTDYADLVAGQHEGIFNVVHYGADPTGADYSDAAFDDALDAIRALNPPPGDAAGAILFVPYGTYKLANTISVNRGMIIQGVSGAGWHCGSILLFDDGVTGLIIERSTTSADGGWGDWSLIRDIGIEATAKTVAGAHGVYFKARAKIENCHIQGFSGDGIHIEAGAPLNANNWSVQNVRSEQNGKCGMSVAGNDSNAGVAIGIDCSQNGEWGIFDNSFLGNTYVGCHTEGNGTNTSITTTLNGAINETETTITLTGTTGFATASGIVQIGTEYIAYQAISGNDLTGCVRGYASGNAQSTTMAAHADGATVTQKFGGYHTEGANVCVNTFIGCYEEGGQNASSFVQNPSMLFGGTSLDAEQQLGSRGAIKYYERWGQAMIDRGIRCATGDQLDVSNRYVVIAPAAGFNEVAFEFGTTNYFLLDDAGGLVFSYAMAVGGNALQLTDATHSKGAGQAIFANGIHMGPTRHMTYSDAAPIAGTHVQGDIVFNQAPSGGGKIGWVCTAGGAPGTWKTFGAIDA